MVLFRIVVLAGILFAGLGCGGEESAQTILGKWEGSYQDEDSRKEIWMDFEPDKVFTKVKCHYLDGTVLENTISVGIRISDNHIEMLEDRESRSERVNCTLSSKKGKIFPYQIEGDALILLEEKLTQREIEEFREFEKASNRSIEDFGIVIRNGMIGYKLKRSN